MKIRAEVIAVETHGDKLCVRLQGKSARESRWADYGRHDIEVPATTANGRTYYVGRVIDLEVRPHV